MDDLKPDSVFVTTAREPRARALLRGGCVPGSSLLGLPHALLSSGAAANTITFSCERSNDVKYTGLVYDQQFCIMVPPFIIPPKKRGGAAQL